MISLYYRHIIYLLLAVAPVLVFGIYVCVNAVNVPYNDDEALLITVNYIHEHPSGFLTSLLQQHNDHRIFFSRFASTVIDFLNGKLDFRIMIILGYLNLILLGHSFFLIFKSFSKNIFFFVPVSILLFSPIVYCTQLWSITAFEQSLSIAFSLYCLYFLQPGKENIWYWSILMAIAATLANLDGVSVMPVALVWLMVQKRKKESLIFGAFSIVYTILFFADFRLSSASQVHRVLHLIKAVLKNFVALSGSIVKVLSDSHGYTMALVVGSSMLAIYVAITANKFYRVAWKKNMIYSISLTEIGFFKILACLLMIALGRSGDNADTILSIRFQIYSASVFIMFYLFLLNNLQNNRFRNALLFCFFSSALVLNLLSYVKYKDAVAIHNDELVADAYNYTNHSFFIHQYPAVPDPGAEFYSHYDFPAFFSNQELTKWKNQIKSQIIEDQIKIRNEVLKSSPIFPGSIYPILNFEISDLPANIPRKNIYLTLLSRSGAEKLFFVAMKPPNMGWFNTVMKKNISSTSFTVTFPAKMQESFYDVALCWTSNNIPNTLLLIRDFKINSNHLILSSKAM